MALRLFQVPSWSRARSFRFRVSISFPHSVSRTQLKHSALKTPNSALKTTVRSPSSVSCHPQSSIFNPSSILGLDPHSALRTPHSNGSHHQNRLPSPSGHDQLGLCLEDGLPGKEITQWLDAQSETRQIIDKYFDDSLITEQNLSDWRHSGHAQWRRPQVAIAIAETARALADCRPRSQPLANQAPSSPIVPNKANLSIHQSHATIIDQSNDPTIHLSSNPVIPSSSNPVIR